MSLLDDWWERRWPPRWVNKYDLDDIEVAEKPAHLLLIELKAGEWRERSQRARAKMAYKVLVSLGLPHRHDGAAGRAWLEKMEK